MPDSAEYRNLLDRMRFESWREANGFFASRQPQGMSLLQQKGLEHYFKREDIKPPDTPLSAKAAMEEQLARKRGQVTVKIPSTTSRLYRLQKITRKGKSITVARDSRGRFTKRVKSVE
jgi:hypothetical protein